MTRQFSKTECIEWQGARTVFGYGKFKRGGKMFAAHRVAYEDARGPIPEGMCVMHICDNPPCVNPEHLRLGTYSENNQDAYDKGRHKPKNQVGGANGNASITEQTAVRLKKLHGVLPPKLAAAALGIAPSQAWRVMSGRAWKHVSAQTRYV